MRLLTPAAAVVSAVAIAMASTGLVVHRSADDTSATGEYGALTAPGPSSTPEPADPTEPTPSPASDDARDPTAPDTSGGTTSATALPLRNTRSDDIADVRPDAQPTTPPTRDPIMVIKDDGLYIVDPDSGRARQILDRSVTDAVWLDNARIGFIRNAAMWIANADGSGERQVFASVNDGGMNAIALSPDRKWIAFVSGASGSNDRPAYVMRSDGAGIRKIWPDTFNSSMSWSPDSTRLAFVAEGMEGGYGTDIALSIYEVATEDVRPLYHSFLDEPTWTPDGHDIVFFDGSIVKIDVATRDYEMLAVQKEFAPTPLVIDGDGKHVYYHEGHDEDWWSIAIDGGTPVNVGSGSLPFLWTRSHGRAAIVEFTGERDCDGRRVTRLVVAGSDLANRETLAVAGTYATLYGVRWSPDGRRLVVRSSLNKTPRRCP